MSSDAFLLIGLPVLLVFLAWGATRMALVGEPADAVVEHRYNFPEDGLDVPLNEFEESSSAHGEPESLLMTQVDDDAFAAFLKDATARKLNEAANDIPLSRLARYNTKWFGSPLGAYGQSHEDLLKKFMVAHDNGRVTAVGVKRESAVQKPSIETARIAGFSTHTSKGRPEDKSL